MIFGLLVRKWQRWMIAILSVAVLVSCASYQTKVNVARDELARRQPEKAVEYLTPLAAQEGNDQLIYLLDLATSLQEAGRYKESAKYFSLAEKIADIQDYHSVSKITASLILSEEMKQYKGDDYEKVLIHGVNVFNYLNMNELDNALTVVRRLNNMLYKFKYEAKKDYEQNPFAFYLSAILFEASKDWDSAYIEYKKAFEVAPNYSPLKEDLIRAAIKAHRSDDARDWQKRFPEIKIKPEWKDPSYGEIVLVYQQGWGPRKGPRPDAPRYPQLNPVYSYTQFAKLIIGEQSLVTQSIFSVQDVAIKTLNNDYAALVAGRVAGVVAKAVVADQIRQKNEALGQLAWIAMNAMDRADVRQWSTLPQSFQFARMQLKPGKYKVKVLGLNVSGSESGEEMQEREIEVRAGKKTFVTWRSVK